VNVTFRPIDLERHFELCVRFLCDTFVCSYGSASEFDELGGALAYLSSLRSSVSSFPAGHVHVFLGETIAGQLEMRLRPDRGDAMVSLFYVVPEQRGTGLAAALHAYAVQVLRDHRVPTARLSVAPQNVRALRFYEKCGWVDQGPRKDRPYVHAMQLDVESL
jgi:GNAT superfamily N-acetyltransferase